MQALAIRFVHPSNGLRVRAIAQSSPSRKIVMTGAGVSPGPHCAHIKTKTGSKQGSERSSRKVQPDPCFCTAAPTRTVTGAILAPHETQRRVVSGRTGIDDSSARPGKSQCEPVDPDGEMVIPVLCANGQFVDGTLIRNQKDTLETVADI